MLLFVSTDQVDDLYTFLANAFLRNVRQNYYKQSKLPIQTFPSKLKSLQI